MLKYKTFITDKDGNKIRESDSYFFAFMLSEFEFCKALYFEKLKSGEYRLYFMTIDEEETNKEDGK